MGLFAPNRSVTTATGYPPAPLGTCLYVVGDIHGRVDCLERVHHAIDLDRAYGPQASWGEVYLGDYIDRGPNSQGVIAALLAREVQLGYGNVAFLLGNHELLLRGFLDGHVDWDYWRRFGGTETVLSYGITPDAVRYGAGHEIRGQLLRGMPGSHLTFLSRLVPHLQVAGYCFVHAGLRPGIPLAQQSIADLTSIRAEFLDCEDPFEAIVVHGHTPVSAPDFRLYRINIDTGAYATNNLTVLRIDHDGATVLQFS